MRRSPRLLPAVIVVFTVFAGCTFTGMQPARQLNHDETVLSATLKEPGMIWVSYVAGQ